MQPLLNPDALSLRKRSALKLYDGYRFFQTKRHPLTYFFWECTLRCNLDCLHCGSDCIRESKQPDMPLDDFLKVVDSIHPYIQPSKTLIVVTGGEPLMRADLQEAGQAFTDRGHPWGFVTNGYAMTSQRFEGFLKAGLKAMTVSLDGLQESHDLFRGRTSSFVKAVETIALAAKVPRFSFDVVTCVNKKNLSELPALRDLLISLGVKRWRIATVFSKGRAVGNPLFNLSDMEFAQVFAFIKQTRDERKIWANYGCEGYVGQWEGLVRDNPFFCRAGVNIGSVLVDGSISACPSLRADYIQGNIYRDDFWDVWQNRFQMMRDRSWARTGECAECDDWNHCHGNGLHLRDEKTGNLLVCHLHRLRQAFQGTPEELKIL